MSAGRQRRRRLGLVALFGAVLALGAAAGSVWAFYTGTAASTGNELVAAVDWTAPSASASAIGKSQGGVPGFVKQGGTYFVYANVTDSGAPPSGVSSVTANASTVTAGQTAAALSPAAFTIGGVACNYRGAQLTATAGLAAGTYTYSLTSKDTAGNTRTQGGYTVVVDNTAPTATDIQTANKPGNSAGRPELGDTVTYTFSEPIDPISILPNWNGEATGVVVRITNGTGDPLTVYNAANTTQLPLGSVNLGRSDYVSSSATFGATGTASTMTMSGSTVTITLGTASSGPASGSLTGTMSWTPSASAFDRAANAQATTARTETGAADREF